MMSLIIRRIVENGYRKQNRGDYEGLVGMFARDAVFEFQGDTPFGGERLGRQAIREWFEEVRRSFGRLHLTAEDVAVAGPPWNLRVVVTFTDRYELVNGDTLANHGFQFLRIAWGKVKEDRILVDLGVVQEALQRIQKRRSAGSPIL